MIFTVFALLLNIYKRSTIFSIFGCFAILKILDVANLRYTEGWRSRDASLTYPSFSEVSAPPPPGSKHSNYTYGILGPWSEDVVYDITNIKILICYMINLTGFTKMIFDTLLLKTDQEHPRKKVIYLKCIDFWTTQKAMLKVLIRIRYMSVRS